MAGQNPQQQQPLTIDQIMAEIERRRAAQMAADYYGYAGGGGPGNGSNGAAERRFGARPGPHR
jgi:hypothetical protein